MAAGTRPLTFSSLIGQDSMKRGLLLNAVSPAIGGVLIRGEKGTAKSTAVRALARILPPQPVTVGCRFHDDPDDPVHRCQECSDRIVEGDDLQSEMRQMRVVELPINASEDRVVGSIDMEAAVMRGERRFEPGVLASANRNILYVDEVNLLDDHLVDVLLDAAAMGHNSVEREGISFDHPARFILVGTMNPEEGELRPQLLDRFGLCVDVAGLNTIEDRVRVMEQAEQEENDSTEDDRLRDVISAARELVSLVTISAQMRYLIALICVDAGVVGHRADIVISRTARAICAWREAELVVAGGVDYDTPAEALSVTAEDVVAAAELGLAHRRRERAGEQQGSPQSIQEQAERHARELAETEAQPTTQEPIVDEGQQEDAGQTSADSQTTASEAGAGEAASAKVDSPTAESAFEGDIFSVRKIQLSRDRRARLKSGKRSQSRSADKRGRYVRAVQTEHTTDLALDATLRAAAPHQSVRRQAEGSGLTAFHIEKQDLRQKVRRRKTGTLIVFVVDASASMDAEQRMLATKGAVLSLLRDAYIRRDKVALVVFSGRTARVVLSPTSSTDLAEARLQRLGVGGTTPLTHGLLAGLKLIRTERLRDPAVLPLLVLISDGRGNISLLGDEPLVEAQRVAAQIGAEGIRLLVIDSARDYTNSSSMPSLTSLPGGAALFGTGYGFNACQDLADRAGGEYLGLYDLSQRAIVAGVHRSLRAG